MAEEGVTNAICLIHEAGNAGLEERCRGFTDGLTESGGTVEQLVVDLNNPTEAQQRVGLGRELHQQAREVQLVRTRLALERGIHDGDQSHRRRAAAPDARSASSRQKIIGQGACSSGST